MDRLRAVAHLEIRPAIEFVSKGSYFTSTFWAAVFFIFTLAGLAGTIWGGF